MSLGKQWRQQHREQRQEQDDMGSVTPPGSRKEAQGNTSSDDGVGRSGTDRVAWAGQAAGERDQGSDEGPGWAQRPVQHRTGAEQVDAWDRCQTTGQAGRQGVRDQDCPLRQAAGVQVDMGRGRAGSVFEVQITLGVVVVADLVGMHPDVFRCRCLPAEVGGQQRQHQLLPEQARQQAQQNEGTGTEAHGGRILATTLVWPSADLLINAPRRRDRPCCP